jgi:hypothetical protein
MGPILGMIIASAIAGGTSAVAGSIASGKNRDAATAQAAADREQRDRELAFNESMADPFRQQMHQGTDLASLDMMERSRFEPVQYTGRNSSYMPTFSGGTSYDKSPELLAAIAALKNSVMRGQTAPQLSNNPAGGRPSVLDLLAMSENGGQQVFGGPAGSPPRYPGSIMRPPGDFGDGELPDDHKNPNRYGTRG